VTLAFGFRLAGGSDDNPWVGLVTFVHPNRFDIFETLPIIDVSGSSTAPR
jgi:hypothetical protein